MQIAGAEDLQYVANLTKRPEFKDLQLSKSGQAKRTAAISSRLLENSLKAWLRVSDACFSAAWATCGYVTKDTAVDLQAAAKHLDPSGLQTAWGALEQASAAVKHSKVPCWQVKNSDGVWADMPSSIATFGDVKI